MARHDVIVIGGGISGASFAFRAARAGRQVLLVEREPRLGGCLHSVRTPDGFWFELGAHTCYNSYGAFLEVVEALGLLARLQRREKPRMRFLDGGTLVPGQNLLALLRLLDLPELLRSLPGALRARPEGQTVYAHYARLVGRGNYGRVVGPVLSAVPSQNADAFPAEMLFKKRPRRKDVLRSFTFPGGLQGLAEAAAAAPGVTARTGVAARSLSRAGPRFAVELTDGSREEAEVVALATPPATAAALLREVAPEAAGLAARVKEAVVDSLGFAVPAGRVAHLPPATFLIPLEDRFHSVVTRDVVPDPSWRGFTFHFKPGLPAGERLGRAAAVLGVPAGALVAPTERRTVLPSPVLGHRQVVEELDRVLAGGRLVVTGNWFGGLAIEDCALRSREEWARIEAGT